MSNLNKNIRAMHSAMEFGKRDDGTEFWFCNDSRFQDACIEAHLDRLPNDDSYSRITDILDALVCNNGDDDEITYDMATDIIHSIEPDVYTADLTKWLGSHLHNMEYMNQAIRDGVEGGFAALQIAQSLYIIEIGMALVEALQEVEV